MTYYYFLRVETNVFDFENGIIIFEQGKLGKPICFLNKETVERLIKTWKKELEKEEVK